MCHLLTLTTLWLAPLYIPLNWGKEKQLQHHTYHQRFRVLFCAIFQRTSSSEKSIPYSGHIHIHNRGNRTRQRINGKPLSLNCILKLDLSRSTKGNFIHVHKYIWNWHCYYSLLSYYYPSCLTTWIKVDHDNDDDNDDEDVWWWSWWRWEGWCWKFFLFSLFFSLLSQDSSFLMKRVR